MAEANENPVEETETEEVVAITVGAEHALFGSFTWTIGEGLAEELVLIANGDNDQLEEMLKHGLQHALSGIMDFANGILQTARLAAVLDFIGGITAEELADDPEAIGVQLVDLSEFFRTLTMEEEDVDSLDPDTSSDADGQAPADDERREPYVVLTVDGPNAG